MKPLLTICIPTYNRPKGLKRALRNILKNQASLPYIYEILVIDDNPNNSSRYILSEFSNNKIRYILNKNNIGLDKNFVKCMKEVKSEYLIFLTDDDIFVDNSMNKLIQILLKTKPSVLSAGRKIIRKGSFVRYERLWKQSKVIRKSEPKELSHMLYDTFVLSGLVLKKGDINFDNHEQFYGSLFAHMFIVGQTMLNGFSIYLSQPLVCHTIGNKVFWRYSEDFNLKDKLKISKQLEKCFTPLGKSLRQEFLQSIFYMLILLSTKPRKLIKFFRINSDILNVHDFPAIVWGSFQLVKNKLKNFFL